MERVAMVRKLSNVNIVHQERADEQSARCGPCASATAAEHTAADWCTLGL